MCLNLDQCSCFVLSSVLVLFSMDFGFSQSFSIRSKKYQRLQYYRSFLCEKIQKLPKHSLSSFSIRSKILEPYQDAPSSQYRRNPLLLFRSSSSTRSTRIIYLFTRKNSPLGTFQKLQKNAFFPEPPSTAPNSLTITIT